MNESLENHYRVNYKLATSYNLSIDSIEDMFPFEKEIYVALIKEDLEKEKNNAAAINN